MLRHAFLTILTSFRSTVPERGVRPPLPYTRVALNANFGLHTVSEVFGRLSSSFLGP